MCVCACRVYMCIVFAFQEVCGDASGGNKPGPSVFVRDCTFKGLYWTETIAVSNSGYPVNSYILPLAISYILVSSGTLLSWGLPNRDTRGEIPGWHRGGLLKQSRNTTQGTARDAGASSGASEARAGVGPAAGVLVQAESGISANARRWMTHLCGLRSTCVRKASNQARVYSYEPKCRTRCPPVRGPSRVRRVEGEGGLDAGLVSSSTPIGPPPPPAPKLARGSSPCGFCSPSTACRGPTQLPRRCLVRGASFRASRTRRGFGGQGGLHAAGPDVPITRQAASLLPPSVSSSSPSTGGEATHATDVLPGYSFSRSTAHFTAWKTTDGTA